MPAATLRYLFLNFLLWACLSANAQFNTTPTVSYIDVTQGLSNNTVSSIYQDHKGFMWFGTQDGLNKYDGYGFKVFRNKMKDSGSLLKNEITTIEGDENNNIWVGTVGGLCVYNASTDKFTVPTYKEVGKPLPQKALFGIVSVTTDDKGDKYFGTNFNGLLMWQHSKQVMARIPLYINDKPIWDYAVTSVCFNQGQNTVWLFVTNVGLCVYDFATKKVWLVSRFSITANRIKADTDNTIWLATRVGIYCYNIGDKKYTAVPFDPKNQVQDFLADRAGTLWILTDGEGLYFKARGTQTIAPFSTPGQKHLLNCPSILSLFEDTEGRKWVGTVRGGVNVIGQNTNPFKNIFDSRATVEDMPKHFVEAFLEDSAKNVWIGTDGGGLRYWNRKLNEFTDFVKQPNNSKSISNNNVTHITQDYTGMLWVATYFGGINQFNKKDNSFKQYKCINVVTKEEEKRIWLIYEDRQKKLWAGTSEGGTLYILNRKTDRFENFDPKLKDVILLMEDSKGTLWGGCFSSLVKIDTLHKKHISYELEYGVRAIHEDKFGNFWLGTEGGGLLLFDRKTGHYVRMTEKDGLPSNVVLNILEDSSGNLWLSTFQGLSKYDIKKKVFKNYSQSDGLLSNQFMYNSALALSTGEFLFGSIKGFTAFYPGDVQGKQTSRNVIISNISIDNAPIEENAAYVTKREKSDVKTLEIPYDQAVMSFDFVTLDYDAPDKIRYAYYLQGWDKGWNYIGNARKANYSRLEPGQYTFRVKSTNADGDWTNPETQIAVIILPPWYKTWWAYFLYVFAGLSAIYGYIRYTKKQAHLNYEVRLAKIETEKERELNEKKLTFFTNVSHEFRTPLTLIINPINKLMGKKDIKNENPELNVVYRNARRLLSLTNQLLLFRKADSGADDLKITKTGLKQLVDEVFMCFTQEAAIRNIDYQLSATQEHIEIYADVEKLEIAVFNLVSNAFKFTHDGGSIHLQIIDKVNTAEVLVTDTGSGIAPETGHTIFDKFRQAKNKKQKSGFGIGLYLVKTFIEKHGGKINYESEVGKGTTFTIELLKGSAHFDTSASFVEAVEKPDILKELAEEPLMPSIPTDVEIEQKQQDKVVSVSEKKSVLVVEDNTDIRNYLKKILGDSYTVYEAADGHEGLKQTQKKQPDIIISDINMDGMDGMELCKKIKADESLSHIPIVLLTGSYSSEMKLKGIENGADDYITKPFETDLLLARVNNILKRQNNLRRYFFDSITLKENTVKVPSEYQDFLNRCIEIVEANLENDEFSIKTFCKEIGMSHSNLYVKVKQISGQTVNSFIRSIRLRRAAVLMLKEEVRINQIAFQVGIGDMKYFREQFNKLFGMNPSDYVKKYRGKFNKDYNVVRAEEAGD